LENDEFSDFLSLIKKIADYDPSTRSWYPSNRKILKFSKQEFEQIKKALSNYVDTTNLVYPELETKFDGNYFIVKNVPLDLYYTLLPDFSYTIVKYDPNWRGFVHQTIKRIWYEDGSIKIYRGMYPTLKKRIGLDSAKYREKVSVSWVSGYEKRDYQFELVDKALDQISECGCATVQIATGGGKTVVASVLVNSLKPKKTFFLSLNTDLLIQAYQMFERANFCDMGYIRHGYRDYNKSIVFSTVQTLNKALQIANGINEQDEWFDEVRYDSDELDYDEAIEIANAYRSADLVIFDECQHVPAKTARFVVSENPNALRFAMSATPYRDDLRDMEIYCLMGDICGRVTSSDLTDLGYLVPADITFVHYTQDVFGDTFQQIKSELFQSDERNQLIADIVREAPKPCLVLVKEISHGRALLKKMDAHFVYGMIDADERGTIFDKLRNESIDVVIATTLADEGLDIPALRSLVLAGGGKSSTRALQRVGRIVRPYKDKDFGYVYDIYDEVKYFDEHSEKRKKIYSTERRWIIHHK
jgi:superfamily II DNA or RNA helicase